MKKNNSEMDGQTSLSFVPAKSSDTQNDVEASDTGLELIKGGRFNAKLFHEHYKENTEKLLYTLLSMQSNDNPLKKGGDSIAFRCSAIIIQNRQNYTVPQNTLLDIITARMSSYPENDYYVITAKELIKELPYEDKTYIYKIMSKACKELNRSPFIFEIDLDNGKKKMLEFQWNEVLMYNGAENLDADEDAYISFTPTKFFRILTLSSTIMHGAHYPVGVSAQISSKYARNLFYYLEEMKNYKEYPTAKPGKFVLSLDELQYIIKYPINYRTTDIRRHVLDVALEEINRIKNIDFSFSYQFLKTSPNGMKKKITHVEFVISKVLETVDVKEISVQDELEEQPSSDDIMVLQMLQGIGLSDEEGKDVLKKYKANKRDGVFLAQAITSVVTTENVNSKCALLCHIMEEGLRDNFTCEENIKRIKKTSFKSKNRFNNFQEHERSENDYIELEKMLLTTSVHID